MASYSGVLNELILITGHYSKLIIYFISSSLFINFSDPFLFLFCSIELTLKVTALFE